MEIKEKITSWITPLLDEQSLFLVDIKVLGKSKVEVFVDGENGIDILQCTAISRLIEKNLDGSQLVSDSYTLDVSSPGMTNPLKVPQQYFKRIGKVLDIVKLDGTTLEATLQAADQNGITILPITKEKKTKKKTTEKEETVATINLAYADIKKATIQFKW